MAYNSVLTFATNVEGTRIAADAAAQVAVAQGAHLDAVALGIDRSHLGYAYLGSGQAILQIAMDRAMEEARLYEKAIGGALKAFGPELRWSADSVVAQLGAVTDLVAARAQYADLVVLAKPYSRDTGPESEAVIEAALFEGVAPVLVVPDTGLKTAAPRRIVLAWNQSREALVAARRALPFLKQAEKVTITVIDPPSLGAERSDPGGMLCQMLVRHGVRAEVSVLAKSLPRVSEVLARQCQDLEADMLVMGAYGHSRFREAILGGATRYMLEQAQLPVFMAH